MKPKTPPPPSRPPIGIVTIAHPYPILLALAVAFALLSHPALALAQTDAEIEASVRNSFVFRTHLAGDTITAHSRGGAVTLIGKVTEGSHKMLAQDTVTAVSGVRSVDNQIEVKGGPAEHSDAWLFLKVKSTLAIHQSVSAMKTQVDVKGGVVTLKGEAANQAQKDQATDYANAVNGVRDMKNEMTLAPDGNQLVRGKVEQKPAEKLVVLGAIDDASVTAQAKMALMTHHAAKILKTTVTTSAGVLTLGGPAATAAERDLVGRLVADINGVKSVVNNMAVGASASRN
ncbi:MAG: BON domain-containing protein [Roseimicrobium sp.]